VSSKTDPAELFDPEALEKALQEADDAITESAKKDAAEFGRLTIKDRWFMGLLVARSTYAGRSDAVSNAEHRQKGKVSVSEFAAMAGISGSKVTRDQKTWAAAVAEGLVPASVDLVPGQEIEWDERCTPEKWSEISGDENARGEKLDKKNAAKVQKGYTGLFKVRVEVMAKAIGTVAKANRYDLDASLDKSRRDKVLVELKECQRMLGEFIAKKVERRSEQPRRTARATRKGQANG
jgi:hypothetical protein